MKGELVRKATKKLDRFINNIKIPEGGEGVVLLRSQVESIKSDLHQISAMLHEVVD